MKRRDPFVQSLITCVLLVVVGLLAITLGKRIVARTEDVYDQLPALVSGGLGGIALVIIGCIFAFIQVSRVCAEQERLQQTAILDEVVALTDVRKLLATKHAAPVAIPADLPAEVVPPEIVQPVNDDTVAIPVIRPARIRRQRPIATGAGEPRPVRRPRAPRVVA